MNKRFAYMGADHSLDLAAKKRFKGFTSVLKKNNCGFDSVLSEKQVSSISMGKKLMHQLIDNNHKADAIYCSNDSVAVGALLHCLSSNINVPDDIAIASFSGLDIALAMPVPITTVCSPRREMGCSSAELILNKIKGEKVKRIVEAGFELLPGKSS